jgi:hypothetical protein
MSIMHERRFVLNAIPEEDSARYHAQVEQAYLLQDDQHEEADNEVSPETLGLEVEVALEYLVRPDQKHAIQIEFDPAIYNLSHHWRIHLNSPQSNFHFVIRQKQGQVSLTKSASAGGAQWDATVSRVAGNPAQYDMKSAAYQV